MNFIPQPVEITTGEGYCQLGPYFSIFTSGADPALRNIEGYLEALLSNGAGLRKKPEGHNCLTITLREDPRLPMGEEGYVLNTAPEGILITGKSARGVFYGVQTLRQLMPPEMEVGKGPQEYQIPTLTIRDEPRFPWRGAMLDVARHVFPVNKIKRFLDLMALHKLNTFHWHLVDDQAWRIEIKKYPKLTEIAAWREESDSSEANSKRYGGFYSQEEIREIVAYAAERFITIVPEIELPGHCSAALTAYPEFGNHDIENYAPKVQTTWGVFPYTYSPREETFRFLEGVLEEVIELFPGPFIHIGGDEAPKDQWTQSPFAQGVMKREGLKDEHELQSWFIRLVETYLAANGRKLIGWDEIQEGGLSPAATMMVWRDWNWARHAVERGNSVVMSPTSHCYLDYPQDNEPAPNPWTILPLEKVYSLEPIPDGLTTEQAKLVLGTQGNIWSEWMPDMDQVEKMAFPRLCALAEVAWSPSETRDYSDFSRRLASHYRRLDALGVNYSRAKEALI